MTGRLSTIMAGAAALLAAALWLAPQPAQAVLKGVATVACAAHQWVSGPQVCSQPAFSDLSGTISAAQLGSAAALTLVSTQTASSSASLAWTGLTGADYVLRCRNLLPATTGVTAYLQFGEGGTPTWETASYDWVADRISDGGAGGSSHSTSDVGFGLTGTNGLSNTAPGLAVDASLFNLSASVTHQMNGIANYFQGSAIYQTNFFGGNYLGDASAITAARVQMSSGNIASGSCSLYQVSS